MQTEFDTLLSHVRKLETTPKVIGSADENQFCSDRINTYHRNRLTDSMLSSCGHALIEIERPRLSSI